MDEQFCEHIHKNDAKSSIQEISRTNNNSRMDIEEKSQNELAIPEAYI